MGIFDDQFDPFADPKSAGILRAAFALMQASGATRTPTGLGEALGKAGSEGVKGYEEAQVAQTQNRLRKAQAAQVEDEIAARRGLGILDMSDPEALRRYGLLTKKPEFITHAERIEKERRQQADLKGMQSQVQVIAPDPQELEQAADQGTPAPAPAVVKKGGIFATLKNAPFPDIAAEAASRQEEVDSAKMRDPEAIRKERERLYGLVEKRLEHEDSGNAKVVRDPSSSTGWSYKNLRTDKIVSKDAPPPSNAPSSGTSVIAPHQKDMHGEDYLSTLPSAMASLVKGVAEGRIDPSKAASMRYGNREALMERVMQYDPKYNGSRIAVWKDFTSGKTAQNVTAMNTVISHMGTVNELTDALKNRDVGAVNALVNRIRTETGKPEINNAEIAIQAMGNELMRVFRQVGASEHETKAWEAKFNAAKGSPQQLKGALKVGAELLQGRIEAVDDQWRRGMDSEQGYPNLLSPKSKAALDKIKGTSVQAPSKEPPSPDKVKSLRDKYLKVSQAGDDYDPPSRGSPKGRVGGGSRVIDDGNA